MISGFNGFNKYHKENQLPQQTKRQEYKPPEKPMEPGCPGLPGLPGDGPKGPKGTDPTKDNGLEKKADIENMTDKAVEKNDNDEWAWADAAMNNNGYTCVMPPVQKPDPDVSTNKVEENVNEKMSEAKANDEKASVLSNENVVNNEGGQVDDFINAFQNGEMSQEDFIAKITDLGATNVHSSQTLGPGLSISIVMFELNGKHYQVKHTNHMQKQNSDDNSGNTAIHTDNSNRNINIQTENLNKLNTGFMAKRNMKAE